MLIKWMIFCLGCTSIEAVQKKPGGTGQGIIKADLLSLKNAVNTLVESQTALKEYLKEELASIRDEVSNLRDDVSNLRDGESNVRDNVLEIKEDVIELKKQFNDIGDSQKSSRELCNATLVAAELKQDFNGINEQMNNMLDKCKPVAQSNCTTDLYSATLVELKHINEQMNSMLDKCEPMEQNNRTTGKYGDVSVLPGVTCLDIQKRRLPEILPSGVYWVTLGNPGVQQLYCDMETDGGGWTLVWTYTFTNYADFNNVGNAVTPRPSWDDTGYTAANTPVSTTPPLSETRLGALEYSKWNRIGSDFMVKSNINQWIACTPNIGSLVDWQAGSLNCRMVKIVVTKCTGVVPSRMAIINSKGPSLFAGSFHFYFFDTRKDKNWPTHDPCGLGVENHINDVTNPRGNVLLR